MDCEQIHQSTDNDQHNKEYLNKTNDYNDDEHDNEENVHVDKNCQCEKSRKQIIFECIDCRNAFCEDCPTGPVGSHCIECMLIETRPLSSTPVKRN